MNYGELKRDLRKHGCFCLREGANHELWYSPITGKTFAVGRHNQKEVASGTLKSIRMDSGLDK